MSNTKSKQYNDLLYKEMREYGIENFRFSILCYSDELNIAYKLEDYFIKEFDTIIDNGKGYNNNYGGKHGLHSETTKNKLSKGFFKNGELNHSFGKRGKESYAGKRVINKTKNIEYDTMRECALKEYGDIKYVKQISKVCDPNSNRFTYKGNVYALIRDDGSIVEKNVDKLPIKHSVAIIEKFSGKTFSSIEECAKYFNLSTGIIRDRINNRTKNDKYKDIYKFEIYN